jgi:hypothetical protein
MKELKNEGNGCASVCGVLKWMEAPYCRSGSGCFYFMKTYRLFVLFNDC